MVRQIWGLFFSPCGNVERTVRAMASGAAARLGTEARYEDLTRPAARRRIYAFGPEDMVFVGVPVYAGRVPNKLLPFLTENLRGGGAAAVAAVSFGNRSFDDALSELAAVLTADGFAVTGAAAAVGQHAFSGKLAPGRPTGPDLARMEEFGARAAEKLLDAVSTPVLDPGRIPGDPAPAAYYQPLKLDGTPAQFLRAVPAVDPGLCNHCGTCASVCPMGSIDREDPGKMRGICIKCHACVHKCRRGARFFTDGDFLSHRAMLERDYARPAEPVYIL